MTDFDDPIYPDVLRWVQAQGGATPSKIQRAFKLGYNRSAHLIERMLREGLVTNRGGVDGFMVKMAKS